MLKSFLFIFMVTLALAGCSETVKGPVTGKKYNVTVGGWEDMDKYKKARKEATSPIDAEAAKEKPVNCSKADCPDDER